MNNFVSTLNNYLTAFFNAVFSWFGNIVANVFQAWNRVNDPVEIRRNEAEFQRENTRQRLGIALILQFIFGFVTFVAILFLLYGLPITSEWFPQSEVAYEGGLIELAIGTFMLAWTTWMCGYYRLCLAHGQMAQFREEFDMLPRAIRRIVISLAILVAAAAVLQRVPELDQQLPMVAEAADWVIDTFNAQMPKVVEWFKSIFSRALHI